nr:MmgE/PrpD family protein [Pseudonocardia acidicola]
MTRPAPAPVHPDEPFPSSPPPTATSALAVQIAALRYDAIGEDARTVAAQCVLDGIGVAIAATAEPAVRILRKTVLSEVADGPATLLGTDLRTTTRDAALVNGTATHALDYDDVSGPMSGHPTVPVLPAVLALGEELATDGKALVTAMVAGIECEVRVGAALGNAHYLRGFHTTATAGTLGAAAAAANMLGLSAEQTCTALGIAATQAAGLKSMFGTMCKPLHAGKAAASGILAAKLAAAGFTAAEDAIAGERGLLATQSDGADLDALTVPFGRPWHVADVLFKFHAACYLTHASIEAALALRAQGLEPAEIESVEVLVTPAHLGVCAIPSPRTGLEGKFSLRFATALALATGRADESRFTDASVADPALVALRDRVRVVTVDDVGRYSGQVTVRSRDGRTWQARDDVGSPRWTRSPAEQLHALEAKFDALVTPMLGEARTAQLLAVLGDLDSLSSVAELTALTAPAPRSHP